MAKTNVEIVRELLGGVLDPEVVRRLTAPNVVYVSLTYDNPELQKLMP